MTKQERERELQKKRIRKLLGIVPTPSIYNKKNREKRSTYSFYDRYAENIQIR